MMARRKGRKSSRKSITQQIKSIQDRYSGIVGEISEHQEKVVTQILIIAQTRAAFYTPQDTNALINSQYRQIIEFSSDRIVGRVGYTQKYAAALHERTGWSPKPPNTPGKRGGGYNTNASSKFLERAFDEERDTINKIIREENRI